MAPESPKRAAAELAVGQSLWSQSQSLLADQGDPAEIEARQRSGIQLITKGLRRGAASEPSATTLAATLLVAEYNLRHAQPQEAIGLLEDPKIGPKMLADQLDPLLPSSESRQRVYQLALLAYVAALPDAADPDALLAKALATLEQIKQLAEQTGGSTNLAATYLLLARSLEKELEAAPANRRDALVAAFQQFLERAAGTTKELSVLSWVADSYANLGKALRGANGEATAASRPFFTKSIDAYREILERSDRNELTLTVQERLLLETRLAIVYRERGDHAAAMAQFERILRAENNQIFVQVEAARTLQSWGNAGETAAYLKAILGDQLDPKTQRNFVWGYGRIARLVAGKAQFDELFYEARYELAVCRYQYALRQPTHERKEVLAQAESDVLMTAKLYPQLGGPQRKSQYDTLLSDIQQSLGKRLTGLP